MKRHENGEVQDLTATSENKREKWYINESLANTRSMSNTFLSLMHLFVL